MLVAIKRGKRSGNNCRDKSIGGTCQQINKPVTNDQEEIVKLIESFYNEAPDTNGDEARVETWSASTLEVYGRGARDVWADVDAAHTDRVHD